MIKPKDNRGFTLIELMVAMAMVAMVMAAVVSTYQLQVRGKNTQEVLTDMNQTARAALEVMTHEIRTAGCDPTLTANARILIAQANQFSFTMDIGNGATFEPDGDTDDNNERVTYTLAGGILGRDTGAGPQALARNVDALQFVYFDEDGNVTATAANIRSVQVNIVARAGQAAGGFRHSHTDTLTYSNPQGDVVFGPAHDSFRRILLTTTVPCFNLGNS